MTQEEQNVLVTKGLIALLPADQQAQCNTLAAQLRDQVDQAGDVVGTLAMMLVGTELQLKASKG